MRALLIRMLYKKLEIVGIKMDIYKANDIVEIARYLAGSDVFASYMIAKDAELNDKYNCDIEDIRDMLELSIEINRDNFGTFNTFKLLKILEERIINRWGKDIIDNYIIFDQRVNDKLKKIYEDNTKELERLIQIVSPIRTQNLKRGKGRYKW